MMCPDPRATIDGSTARLHRNGPRTLTACTMSQSATGVSWQIVALADPVMPALLTSTSMSPSRSAIVTIAFVTDASLVTSQRSVRSAASAAPAGSRSSATTMMPSSRSRAQVARPMPDAPPVTTATRSAVTGLSVTGPSVTGLSVTGAPSQVDRVELAGPEPAELDEVLGVEEQLVQLCHLVHRPALRLADQVVDVLERVLGAEPHVMGAENLARVRVDHELEPAGQQRPGEGIQHRPFGGRQRERLRVGVVGRHLDLDHVVVALLRLGLGQAAPGHLVGGVQEVGIAGVVELVMLAHDVAGGGAAALARLEHLHRRAEQVPGRPDGRDGRPHGPVGDDEPPLVGLQPERLVHGQVRALAGADEQEVCVDLPDVAAGGPVPDASDAPVAEHLDQLGTDQDL